MPIVNNLLHQIGFAKYIVYRSKFNPSRMGKKIAGEIHEAIPADESLNPVINPGFQLSTGNHQGIHCQGFEFILSGIYRDWGNEFDPFADQ